jgi:hypothetical protein
MIKGAGSQKQSKANVLLSMVISRFFLRRARGHYRTRTKEPAKDRILDFALSVVNGSPFHDEHQGITASKQTSRRRWNC